MKNIDRTTLTALCLALCASLPGVALAEDDNPLPMDVRDAVWTVDAGLSDCLYNEARMDVGRGTVEESAQRTVDACHAKVVEKIAGAFEYKRLPASRVAETAALYEKWYWDDIVKWIVESRENDDY